MARSTGVQTHGEYSRVPPLGGNRFRQFMVLQRRLSPVTTVAYHGKPRAECDFCGRPIKHGETAFIEKVRRSNVALVLTACEGCPELIRDPLVVTRA